jgi:cytoskeletal protein CcmA (bactofilin family)
MIGKKKNSFGGAGGKGNKDQITTLVGEGASFEGYITTSSARIDGSFKGEAKLYGSLIIGEKGLVLGDVSSPKVIVYGKIEGKVKANNLDIKETGNVEGDITVQTLTVDSGGTFNGSSTMKHSDHSKESESKSEVASFQEFKSQK